MDSGSILEEEGSLRWGFLDANDDACAVVSDRMELVYLNESARELVPEQWFGRRCFEIFPTANELCAFKCPTIAAVQDAREVYHCEEVLRVPAGETRKLDVAVIPLAGMSGDAACALLLLRPKSEEGAAKILPDARKLRADLLKRFEHH